MTEQSSTPARRVVVAEDESLIRLDIVETLRDNGFDVVGEAGDGEEAVRLVEELRPDLVVNMPGGKKVVVDAKAPLQAFLDAYDSTQDVDRDRHLAEHARLLRDHVRKLSARSYWAQFPDAPDFVILFLPAYVGMRFLAHRLGRQARASAMMPLDRLLGGGFGMLKGLVSATLVFLLANLATDMTYGPMAERPAWMTRSRTFPLLNASGHAIVDMVDSYRHAAPAKR